MAAYGAETKANIAKILQQKNDNLKVFLFDKDDTLVYYEGSNDVGIPHCPVEHGIIFDHITKNPETTKWVMTSRGGGTMMTPKQLDVSSDKSLDIFRQQVLKDGYDRSDFSSGMGGKENFYCAHGKGYRSTIQSNFETPIEIFVDKESIKIDPTLIIQLGKVKEREGKLYLSFKESDYELQKGIVLEFPSGIVYRLNLKEFFAIRDIHEDGNNKIIQGLFGLAGAGVAVNTDEKMKALGIELLDVGDTAEVIEPNQVFGLDDDMGCVVAWQQAGFVAHHADNPQAIDNELKYNREFISDALNYDYEMVAVEGDHQSYEVKFYNNWKKHVVEHVFHNDDRVIVQEDGEKKELNLKEFLGSMKLLKDKKSVKVLVFKPSHAVEIFYSYLDPLGRHLGFDNLKQMTPDFIQAEISSAKNLHLGTYKKAIFEKVNKNISVPIAEEDVTIERFKPKGTIRRTLYSFAKQSPFERDALFFLKSIHNAPDEKSIFKEVVRLAMSYPEKNMLANDIIGDSMVYMGLDLSVIEKLVEEAKNELSSDKGGLVFN